jgi:hypothetical protein
VDEVRKLPAYGPFVDDVVQALQKFPHVSAACSCRAADGEALPAVDYMADHMGITL